MTTDKVHKEYLYATPPNGEKQEWLLRENNIITIGDMVTGTAEQKQLWKDMTRDNTLFLSVAIQGNSYDFYYPGLWFKEKILILDEIKLAKTYVIEKNRFWYDIYKLIGEEHLQNKSEILSFLNSCDVAFNNFEIDKNGINLKYSVNGSEYILPFNAESDGTKHLFELSAVILDILKNGSVWIADELHRSLHPKAFEFVIKLFQDEKTNPKNAQLIFTSHDTHPMKFLLKSDVWIAHKNTESKQTELYSISDFKNVPDAIDIQKEYLDDIFGGLPNIAG